MAAPLVVGAVAIAAALTACSSASTPTAAPPTPQPSVSSSGAATPVIDSSGLHILLNTARRMSRQSRGFAVICRPGPVMRVIERARLTDALRVVSDLSEYERHAP